MGRVMNKLIGTAVALLVLLVTQSDLWAQGRGGGVGGGGGLGGGTGGGKPGLPGKGGPSLPNDKDFSTEGCEWVEPPSKASDAAKSGEKFLLVYVYEDKANGNSISTDFFRLDVIQLSKTTWVFSKMPYTKDDAELRKLGVRRPGTVLGLDRYGNEWKRLDAVSAIELKGLLASVPELVKRFTEKLQADFARAEVLGKTDLDKAGKLFADIARNSRKGYKEIEDAAGKVREISARQFKAVELAFSADEKQAMTMLKQLAGDYKDLPSGVEAEIRLAEFDLTKGAIPSSIERAKRALRVEGQEAFVEEVAHAKKVMEKIAAEGNQRIAAALQLAQAGDRAKAVEAFRQIARDFAGTEAGKKAADVAKSSD